MLNKTLYRFVVEVLEEEDERRRERVWESER
jgi:hypothetical protein